MVLESGGEMKQNRVRQIAWIVVFCSVVWVAGDLLANAANQTQNVITIHTPGKKSGGKPTRVVFYHQRHVQEFGAQCAQCHPSVKAELNAAGNTQKNVHETCRQCHAKNKPGKNFICSRCHRK